MERDEAIAILRKEYLCVDRDCGIERSCGKCDLVMPSKEPILEAYRMAIKALEQETKWDRLYSWLNDMRLGIAPDETVTDVDERNARMAQTDILDEIMERLASVTPQPCEDAISRREVLDEIRKAMCEDGFRSETGLIHKTAVYEIIRRLPSVTQEEDCDTCKYGNFGGWKCVTCRASYPSHYEREE